jgi:HAMP domain-containing protein
MERNITLRFYQSKMVGGLIGWQSLLSCEADFMEQINANTRTIIVLCAIAFATATAIGVLTARWISGQIFKLNRASQAIANGDLNQNVKVNGILEVENLAGPFNSMAHQLEESFAALEAKNAARRNCRRKLSRYLRKRPRRHFPIYA